MGQLITCTSAGVYPLTRGQKYELLATDTDKQQVRVCSDLGRRRWFPAYNFDLSGGHVPVLVSWRFDDPVIDPLNARDETNNCVDVVLQFDDGNQRWCIMATPDYLKNLLQERWQEPMIYARQLIIVRNLTEKTVEEVLAYMDQQGELEEFSLSIEPSEDCEDNESACPPSDIPHQ